MSDDRFARIEELFRRALELEGEERAELIEDVRSRDPELADGVEELLRHDASPELSVGDAIDEMIGDLKAAGGPSLPDRVGPYRLERVIGRGGMGVVHLATREEPYRQRVAVKILHHELAGNEQILRFRSERQILAGLDHPNVSRLLDGGTTETGAPFIVMEYVDGLPIDEYCRRNLLDVRQTLELFCTVCDAVHFAHSNLIVHRDIKPSNILVDANAQPKLLDFGIAKLIDPTTAPHTIAVTAEASRLLTPEYASPEQLRGETITTATDVYALGVLLFKLLTGERPYRVPRGHLWELARVICEEEPLAPSVAVSETQPASPRRQRELAGDLDNIVLKALGKKPAHRYATPAEMAADIRRHLSDEPVVASSPGPTTRALKFVRRHRLPVGAAALVLTALVAGAIAATTGFVSASRAEREALREARAAQQVSEFLVEIFRLSDPSVARGNEITAREILDRGARRIETELADQPVVQARMMRTMGEVYENLGLYEPSKELIDASLTTLRAQLGEDDVETLESLVALAAIENARGVYDEAEAAAREARRGLADAVGRDDPRTLRAGQLLGDILRRLGRYDEAEPIIADTLDRRRRALGEEHPDTLRSMRLMGDLHRRQEKWAEARRLYEQAAEAQERVLGADDPNTLLTLNNLANVAAGEGRLDEAEALYARVFEAQERVLGERNRNTLVARHNLATLLVQRERSADAIPHFEELVEIFAERFGRQHPTTLIVAYNLGRAYGDVGRHADALRVLGEVHDAQVRVIGERHPDTIDTLMSIAENAARGGLVDRALGRLEQAVDAGFSDAARLDDPAFEALRGHPDFAALAERLAP
jgi:serine/threonine protein kinase/tetratricopeptide (TPR) repeat protein